MANIEEHLLTDIAHDKDLKRAADGDLDKISGLANLKSALLRRLVTTPGALAHRPNYGVGIKDFQNAPNSLDNQRSLALRVKEQFEQDFRVKEVTGLRFDTEDDDPSKTVVVVKVKVAGYEEVELGFQNIEERI